MRKKKIHQEDEAAIDMTPMLDIVFIMLIFFIVTTSFVKESGLEVNRPSASTAKVQKRASIMIGVHENGDVWMQKRRVDVRAVRANVERMKAESPEGSVVIQADKGAKTGVLVQVMDQVRLAGVSNVSIAASAERQ